MQTPANAFLSGLAMGRQRQNALASLKAPRRAEGYNALQTYGGPTRSAANAFEGNDRAAYIREGLIRRGIPEYEADAWILNMQDESGLNPGINEIEPLVPGSRGGFGLYQLTGPRRVAYEDFAQRTGAPVDDIDAQLDFLMYELQGPESRAAERIRSADTTGEAAAAIVNHFLRPAESHRARRSSRYLNLG